jgi:Fic family protein
MKQIQEIINRIDEKKKKLDDFRPLPPELIKNLEEWFAVDYTYNSNAIEGNTLSLSETALVVEKGITIGGKTIREHLEAIDHMRAIDFIKVLARKPQNSLTIEDFLSVNAIAFKRTSPPTITIKDIEWLCNTNQHPIINTALSHLKLVNIYPSIDGMPDEALAKSGNGRTSRLLMNLILLQSGYPLAIIKNENRSAYITALENARATENYINFYMIVAQAVEESLDIYLQATVTSE